MRLPPHLPAIFAAALLSTLAIRPCLAGDRDGESSAAATPDQAPRKGEYQITAKDRAHWAFRPIVPPPLPAVRDRDRSWGTNPIDAFIRAGLEARGLQPNPPATKQELIRRASYDLTGLP